MHAKKIKYMHDFQNFNIHTYIYIYIYRHTEFKDIVMGKAWNP